MKIYIPPTMFACLVASSLVAQPATPPPPKFPAPEPPAGVPRAEVQDETIIRDATGSGKDGSRAVVKIGPGASPAGTVSRKAVAFQFGAGAKSSSRSLAIQTSDVDREKVDAIEEDLSVMARILQKAARSLREDDRFNAMGLELDAAAFGSASGARNIYLEGHGALFLLRVEYPLVGPRDNTEPNPQEPPPSSIWEEEREAFLGANQNGDQETIFTVRRGRSEPYDEARVEGLKTSLLDALKHAGNIRHLAPQEFVTVVVQGGDATTSTSGGTRVRKEKEKDKDKENRLNTDTVTTRRTSQKGESVMTIRVKKSDIDAFAAGKIDSNGFQQKATVQTYLRRGEPAPRPLR
ncbi:MAG TPA: hypothetical protein VJS65_13890 [Verrucomicrobiae bacterium]|nr:hypothetical protein [Verrucomicrobiae bacterium]